MIKVGGGGGKEEFEFEKRLITVKVYKYVGNIHKTMDFKSKKIKHSLSDVHN